MTNIEMLYEGKTIEDLLEVLSPQELIEGYKHYLNEIVVVGMTIKEGVLGRTRYFDERTTELTLEIIRLFGKDYPEEVILFLSEQNYILRNKIIKQFNLFAYLVQHMDIIQRLRDRKVYQFLDAVYDDSSEQIFGKQIYSSWGNRGKTIYGFVNEAFSKNFINNEGVFGVNFQLLIQVFSYKTIDLGRKLGVKEETLERLAKANEHTEFLKLPKHRKTSGTGRTVGLDVENEFKEALDQFISELNLIISKDHPGYEVKREVFFQTRADVDTNFYIAIEKNVEIKNDYTAAHIDLVDTIITLSQIENQYFKIEDMNEDLVEYYRELSKKRTPLFA